jgi:hypothetical protein
VQAPDQWRGGNDVDDTTFDYGKLAADTPVIAEPPFLPLAKEGACLRIF